ncbi:hypothetical protein BD626DRAFT_571591 [Schizophyllum amplum]|uniref:Uncharacterized protein n=1 Tax=Schizophyllum amplum TaxID=97359 RepID=A0A550C6W0_9AGAR|nr:hypothetical protein BD626DRAFT_571591 [Auriculariopsis ampla]
MIAETGSPGTFQRQLHDIIERPNESAHYTVHDDQHDHVPLLSRQAIQQTSAFVFPSYPSPIFEEDSPTETHVVASAQAHGQGDTASLEVADRTPDELQPPDMYAYFVVPGSPVSPATPSAPSPEPTATPGSAASFDAGDASASPAWDAIPSRQRPRGRQRSSVGPNTNFCLPRSFSSGNLRITASPSGDRPRLATIPSPRLVEQEATTPVPSSSPVSSDSVLRRARSASCTAAGASTSASLPVIGSNRAPGAVGRARSESVRNAVYIPDQSTLEALALNAPGPIPETLRISTSTSSSRFSAATAFSTYSGFSAMTHSSRPSTDVPLTPQDTDDSELLQKFPLTPTPPVAKLPREDDMDTRVSIYSAQTDGSPASSTYSLLNQALPAGMSKIVNRLEGRRISCRNEEYRTEERSLTSETRRRTKSTPRPPPITPPSRSFGLPNIELEIYPPLPDSRPDSRANTEGSSQPSSRAVSRRSSRTPLPADHHALPASRSPSRSRSGSRPILRHAASFAHSPGGSQLTPSSSPYPPVLIAPVMRPGHSPRSASLSSPQSPRFSGVIQAHSPRSSSLSHVYDHLPVQQPQRQLPIGQSPRASRPASVSRPSSSKSRPPSVQRPPTASPRHGFARHASTPALRHSPTPSLSGMRHSPSPSFSGMRHSPSPSLSTGPPITSMRRSPQPPTTHMPMAVPPNPTKRASLRPSPNAIAALMSARSSLMGTAAVKPQRAPYTRSQTDTTVFYGQGEVMNITSDPSLSMSAEEDAGAYSDDDEDVALGTSAQGPPWAGSTTSVSEISCDSAMAEPFRRTTPDPNARLTLVPVIIEERQSATTTTASPPPPPVVIEPMRRSSFGDMDDDPFARLSSGATIVNTVGWEDSTRPASTIHGGPASRPDSVFSKTSGSAEGTLRRKLSPYNTVAGLTASPGSTPDVFSASAEDSMFFEVPTTPGPSITRPRAASRTESARSVRFPDIGSPRTATLQPGPSTPGYESSMLSFKRPSTADRSSNHFLASSLFSYQERPNSSHGSTPRGSKGPRGSAGERRDDLHKQEERPTTADAVADDKTAARKTGFFANFRLRRKHDSQLPPASPSPNVRGKQRAELEVEVGSPVPRSPVPRSPLPKPRGGDKINVLLGL